MKRNRKTPKVLRLATLICLLLTVAVLLASCSDTSFSAFLREAMNLFIPTDTTASQTESTTETTTSAETTTYFVETTEEGTVPQPTEPSDTTAEEPEYTYPPATVPVETSADNPARVDPVISDLTLEDVSTAAIAKLITQKFLKIKETSRPGYKLTSVKNIVVHYVANPGTSAANNWSYFEQGHDVSAHFIIGLDGEILQCMPLDEVAWAIGTKEGNYSSISIECCHPDATGKFNEATYRSLVKLVSWLCNQYGMDADAVLRHYDYERPGGWRKNCPIYYVEHPIEWEKFKDNLVLNP